MKIRITFIVSLIIILFSSCEKENNEPTFDVNLKINKIICYPEDSTSLNFSVLVNGGTAPYEFNWKNPSGLVGEGPFTFNLKDDLLIELKVRDAKNTEVNFYSNILKDTIDSLNYDYRNDLVGTYIGNGYFIYPILSTDSTDWDVDTTIYIDTILISKHMVFTELTMTRVYLMNGVQTEDIYELEYNYINSELSGYHSYGSFYNDSLFIHYSRGIGLPHNEFRGGKMK